MPRALRRRELVELAEQAGADHPAALALELAAVEANGMRVVAAIDDAGEVLAGELAERAERDLAIVGRVDAVRRLTRRASVSGGWALLCVDGALVLVLHGRARRARRDVVDRIRRERNVVGRSFREIARDLEADGIPAPQSARWSHRTVQRLCEHG